VHFESLSKSIRSWLSIVLLVPDNILENAEDHIFLIKKIIENVIYL
jgi:hypothetical protein